MQSVLRQTSKEFEYILVDGGSNDGSKEYIADSAENEKFIKIKWVSEKDNGIYHAMNKGIGLAESEFLQFLNSGDILIDSEVTEKMLSVINVNDNILYGNMLKQLPKGLFRDKGLEGRKPTFLDFFYGTINHSSAYIRCSLFEKYGLYDENLRIVSDWKWYLQVIILSDLPIRYTPIDVTWFDMNGISNSNRKLEWVERENVLEKLIPRNILEDYNTNAYGMEFYKRIKTVPSGMFLFKLFDRFYAWIHRKVYNNYIKEKWNKQAKDLCHT